MLLSHTATWLTSIHLSIFCSNLFLTTVLPDHRTGNSKPVLPNLSLQIPPYLIFPQSTFHHLKNFIFYLYVSSDRLYLQHLEHYTAHKKRSIRIYWIKWKERKKGKEEGLISKPPNIPKCWISSMCCSCSNDWRLSSGGWDSCYHSRRDGIRGGHRWTRLPREEKKYFI